MTDELIILAGARGLAAADARDRLEAAIARVSDATRPGVWAVESTAAPELPLRMMTATGNRYALATVSAYVFRSWEGVAPPNHPFRLTLGRWLRATQLSPAVVGFGELRYQDDPSTGHRFRPFEEIRAGTFDELMSRPAELDQLRYWVRSSDRR